MINEVDKNHKTIGRMFDRIAPTYDLLNKILSARLDKNWRKNAIEFLGVKPGDIVLDIATGTGDMAYAALDVQQCSVVGIDLSYQMLSHAGKKSERSQVEKYNRVQADALHMPFEDSTFNHAMSGFGVRNVENMHTLFREVARVIKKDGKFSILELSYPRIPLIKMFHMMHLRYIMPFIGGLISRDFAAYRYLRDSVIAFPEPAVIEKMLEECGLKIVSSKDLLFNTAHIYVAQKK